MRKPNKNKKNSKFELTRLQSSSETGCQSPSSGCDDGVDREAVEYKYIYIDVCVGHKVALVFVSLGFLLLGITSLPPFNTPNCCYYNIVRENFIE